MESEVEVSSCDCKSLRMENEVKESEEKLADCLDLSGTDCDLEPCTVDDEEEESGEVKVLVSLPVNDRDLEL